jgi:hypothetical protein
MVEETMGIVDTIENKVKEFIIKIALKKAIVSGAKLVVSYCASKGIIFVGTFFGVVIDTGSIASIEAALTLFINSGLAFVRNWVKVKWPKAFGWL